MAPIGKGRVLNPGTIAGVATPFGDGGVGIIRISGPEALKVGSRVFSRPLKSIENRRVSFGKVFSSEKNVIDEGLVLVMRGPHSYTGEDVVEIQCHGGRLIVRRVLEAVLKAGARQALAGEFTERAYLHGKMDLAQAEAVQAMIGAKNELALEAALRHLEGALSKKISSFKERLTEAAAVLEAWVDFPEEGLEFTPFEEMICSLRSIHREMLALLDTCHEGKTISEGLHIVLAGSPNVGKSSLMNALLQKERAIVSPIPGTTRDLVEDHLQLGNLHVRLNDKAGIRTSFDPIEEEGVRRSKRTVQEADLILFIADASIGLTPLDQEILPLFPKEKTVFIWNKIDILNSPFPMTPFFHVVKTSALTSEGIGDLKKSIEAMIWKNGPPSKDEVLITEMRHKEALSKAAEAVEKAVWGLNTDISPEFVTFDVRLALVHLNQIIGTDIQEDILSSIFSKFCVGK